MIVGYFHTVYVCFSTVLNSIILKLLKIYIFQVYIRFVRTKNSFYVSLRVIITDNNICVILYCMKLFYDVFWDGYQALGNLIQLQP